MYYKYNLLTGFLDVLHIEVHVYTVGNKYILLHFTDFLVPFSHTVYIF